MIIFNGYYISILFAIIGLYSLLIGTSVIDIPRRQLTDKERKYYRVSGIMLLALAILRAVFTYIQSHP